MSRLKENYFVIFIIKECEENIMDIQHRSDKKIYKKRIQILTEKRI